MNTKARVIIPNRAQIILDVIDYEELIPQDHPARIIVRVVESLNLEPFYAEIKARDGFAGRSAFDPKLLLCIWLYATIEGIGSARLVERRCNMDNAFRWICGGLKINYHTLSDFRTENMLKLDELLTDLISTFISSGVIKLKSVAIDGSKISASASKKSFKTRRTLNKIRKSVAHHVKALRQESEQDSRSSNDRSEQIRQQKILERERKVQKALSELSKVESTKEAGKNKCKKGEKVSEAKVSTTDSEARLMRFSDGSVDAGYNCQIALDPETYMVLSVEVENQGNDRNLLKPMIENVESRYGINLDRVLVDSGYPSHQDIIDLAGKEKPTLIYSPPLKKKKNIKPESLRKREKREAGYADAVKAFYKRMANNISKKYYKRRSRIETFNGILHNRMPTGFRLRSKAKAKSELLLQAIAHNMMQGFKLMAFA